MSDTNQIELLIAPESTFATSPGAAGTWGTFRALSESFKPDLNIVPDEEIRNMRGHRHLHWVDKGASGSLNMQSYYDDNATAYLMQWALGSSGWSNSSADTTIVSAAAVSITQSSRQFAKDVGVWTSNQAIGDWVYISGAANSASNGYHKVESVTGSNTFTVETAIGADESGVTLTIVEMSAITDGTTLTTAWIQRDYNDLSNIGEMLLGMGINGWSWSTEGTETMKQSFDWLGYYAESLTSLESADSSASTNGAMISPKHCDWIREGNSYAGVACLGASFQVANNLRKRYEQGTFGVKEFKLGDFEVTGTLRAYLADHTLMDKLLNNTESKIAIATRDATTTKGNAFIYDFPKIEYTDGRRVGGGRNQDVIVDLSWRAKYFVTDDCVMKVAKTGSA